MPRLNLTVALRKEYVRLYNTCELLESRYDDVDAIADSILEQKNRYVSVAEPLSIPWYFVAAIHNLESSLRFTKHLHNGDPLSARTVHIPAGRPIDGDPPFTWVESARDALIYKRLDTVNDWSLPRLLYEIEKYNGWGYRLYHPEVLSPYLWSFCSHYDRGKYIADGTWSDTARSRQCGAAVLIRRLEEREEIPPLREQSASTPLFFFSNDHEERVEDLQRFLNTFDFIRLRVDGAPGKKTSGAVKNVFGHYLSGDPRE